MLLPKQDFEDKVIEALAFFGEPADLMNDCDFCDDGSVWLNLTQILPPNSIPQ